MLENRMNAYAEAEHDHVCVFVGEGAQTIEFLLAGCIPQRQFHVDIINEEIWTMSMRERINGMRIIIPWT